MNELRPKTWKLTEGSMLEPSIAAGAVYVSYADYNQLLAANREQKAEIERLTALEFTLQAQRDRLFEVVNGIADANWRKWQDGLNTPGDFIDWSKSIASQAVHDVEKLASLRASIDENPEDAWIRASESLRNMAAYCFNEWGMTEAASRVMNIKNYAYVAPTLP